MMTTAISNEDRGKILNFVRAGASNKAIANRFKITESDVEQVIYDDEHSDEIPVDDDDDEGRGTGKFDPEFRRKFRKEWTEITTLLLSTRKNKGEATA